MMSWALGGRLAVLGLVLALTAAAAGQGPAAPLNASDLKPGEWAKLGLSGGALGGSTVYCPTRRQVLGFGGLQAGNEVRSLDLDKSAWSADYEKDKCNVGGNFYGGQDYAMWLAAADRPGAFFLFRQACWDSTRSRLVAVMQNITAAYDPAGRTWTNLNASFDNGRQRKYATTQPAYDRPWFAPVPGQWGSCAYDPVNDQVVVFPLWVTRTSHWRLREPFGPDRPDDAGVPAGHYGTMVFDCKSNTWSTPVLGSREMLDLREQLAGIINRHRRAAQAGSDAMLARRNGRNDEAAGLMKAAADAQKAVNDSLAAFRAVLEEARPAGHEAEQVASAVRSLGPTVERAGKAQAGLAGGKLDDLPAHCAQQRVVYRLLRLVRDRDLYVQPTPRCSTSIVFDSKNRVLVMAGGDHLDRRLNDTWVYDCPTRRWQRKAPAPEPADWPGMCFDSRRGWVLYATENATYGYDASRDQWLKLGPGRPKGAYCDMAYDQSRDLYVLNVANNKYGPDETTWLLKPADTGEPVAGEPAAAEEPDEASFPPPADPAAADRLKAMPANTWVRANPPFEPTHRSWSTMSYDPTLRAVIYQGGGHAGTMDNTISAYFAECNRWVNAFAPQWPPRIFGAWSCASGMWAFERGMTPAFHARWYESYAGRMVYGGQAGFTWATRERPTDAGLPEMSNGRFCLYGEKGWLVGPAVGTDSGNPIDGRTVYVVDLASGKETAHRLTGDVPKINCEWSGLCAHPDRNMLVLHGAGDSRKGEGNQTWLLDLAKPTAWQKVELASTTPTVGMAKLSAIPGTDYCVCAMPGSNELWVFSFTRRAWKPLPADDGDDKIPANRRRFDLYGQCVWDPHNKVFVMVGLRGEYSNRKTFLLKPDFSRIQW